MEQNHKEMSVQQQEWEKKTEPDTLFSKGRREKGKGQRKGRHPLLSDARAAG